MTHSQYLLAPPLPERLATGYLYQGGLYQSQPVDYWGDYPSSSLVATSADMARFMIAQLEYGCYGAACILRPETVAEMQLQQYAPHPQMDGHTYGFAEGTVNRQRQIGHSSAIRGFGRAFQFWGKRCEKIRLSDRSKEAAVKESKEEKRARLLGKAAQAIEAYLEWEEKNPEPDLTQIEEIALKLRKEFGQEIAQVAIEGQAMRVLVPGPKCSKCGEEMHYKGQKRTKVESRTGNLDVERGYYYCPKCRERIFPPGPTVEAA